MKIELHVCRPRCTFDNQMQIEEYNDDIKKETDKMNHNNCIAVMGILIIIAKLNQSYLKYK